MESLRENEQRALTGQVYWRFNSVQSLSRVRLFATPWTAARQASLSITSSRTSLKLKLKLKLMSQQLLQGGN